MNKLGDISAPQTYAFYKEQVMSQRELGPSLVSSSTSFVIVANSFPFLSPNRVTWKGRSFRSPLEN